MFTDERTLEDWAEANIEKVAGPGSIVIGRQMRLPTGEILDLLALRPHHLMPSFRIVELKRDRITPDAVMQVLGYMGALGECLAEVTGESDDWLVRGVLAAPDISAPAGRMVNAAMELSFTRLAVSIQAEQWPRVYCNDTVTEVRHSVGMDAIGANRREMERRQRAQDLYYLDEIEETHTLRMETGDPPPYEMLYFTPRALTDCDREWCHGVLTRTGAVIRQRMRTRYPNGHNARALPPATNGARP